MLEPFFRSLALLTTPEKRRLYLLLAMSAVAAIVQTAAILAIMPFILLLANPSILETSDMLARIYTASGADSYHEFLVWFGVFGILVLTLGNLFLAVEHWAVSRYITMLGHRVEQTVLSRMLRQPYEYFVAHNSARLSDIVLNQVERVVDGIIGRFVVVFSSAALAVFVVLMLLLVSLQTTLVTLAGLLALYLAVFLLLRRRITRHGEELTRLSGDTFTVVREMLDGIKEIKTRRAERFFASRFERPSLRMSKLAVRYSVLSFLPHFILETLVFAGLVAVALHFILVMERPGFALALIALYGFAAYRLVPSLKSVFEGISDMQHNADALRIVLEHGGSEGATADARDLPAPSREIRVEGVAYAYEGQREARLADVDLAVPVGTSVCLFGPSGSGKTTLLNVFAGLIRPQQGRLLCDDAEITPATIAGWRRLIGYCPQNIFLFDDTVASNIAFGEPAERIDPARVAEVAAIARLDTFIGDDFDRGYETLVGEQGNTLSGGQRQRIGIARALYHDPAILVLDESFTGLDAANREAILDNLFTLGKTLIFATHEREIAERCDMIAVLDQGRLAR